MNWIALFSGGKDSSWALYRALDSGRTVSRLLTVHPAADSYMYHVPATDLAALAADSIGIDLLEVESAVGTDGVVDSGTQGDAELEPLERALSDLDTAVGVDGIIAGAVESEFQTTRIEAMAERLDAETYTPLWERDPVALAEAMLAAGFEIQIVQVAAAGLDESWLGRSLDRAALEELIALNERYGVHVLGEGGEFETLVTDGPHMDRPIELEYAVEWDGTRGKLQVTDAWLGE
ncbi:diphthine--ammonia ligase [Halalkalicoccus jeotgali]|uniref:ATP binding protein n=1 Tax=Halalkalicoccus jeotgali (strain DSM 18796 / CECT 7217 / JCM 14584 / KCTC 4019 / B3) TaxID=795797 RepID=D8J6W6_HALJB|nr:diphthine--ammonia ligase [Halalkalicoccus jeotgali]ADJ15919.1 ATP binding protein [Halalkalicoccus jeotgali B3]ELY38015.1 ATP binding protein [Halalkalicoccus jeotgali B3]